MLALWLICGLSAPLSSLASEIRLDDLNGSLSPKWVEKEFKGKTLYQVVKKDDIWCIEAKSQASASALYYEIEYDSEEYPILSWSWKVDHVLAKGDALMKEGDDYAARVYIVFPSLIFWKTKALNYIWANKLPKGMGVPNPYTKNSIMIAVQSGPEKTGQWVKEKRNVFEDYRKFFGEDPPKVGAIAIMSDTDNTGERAVAWYGPIRILTTPGD